MTKDLYCSSSILVVVLVCSTLAISAQPTAFSYQGSLADTGGPANGAYQMQFKLFDAASGGTQIGSTLADVPISAVNGVFRAQLDFGSTPFPGAVRWLEIAVRRNSGEPYVTLSPRERLTSSPYSVRTLSAAMADDSQKLGGINASEYVTATNSASESFIKNQSTQQATSNFNVSGSGTVGSLNSSGAVSIGGTAAPATAPAGQGRIYFDSAANKFKISESGAAFVNLVGAGGVSGSGTVNRLPYFAGATTLSDSVISQVSTNIGVGTTNPSTKLHILPSATVPPRVESSSTTGFAAGWDFYHGATGKGYVGVADTAAPFAAGELMLFGGGNVKTSLWANGTRALTVNTNGAVGIGTTAPENTLDVNGFFRAKHIAGGNVVTETNGGDNAWAKLWMITTDVQRWSIGTSRNFNGNQLYFANENQPASIKMAIMPNGLVGIGTANPAAKLDIAQTGTGQPALRVDGNAYQSNTGSGFVKIGLYVNSSGVITRCFNGVTGATGPTCGITVTHNTGGPYSINFGGNVVLGFFSIMSHSSYTNLIGMTYAFTGSGIDVYPFQTNTGGHLETAFVLLMY